MRTVRRSRAWLVVAGLSLGLSAVAVVPPALASSEARDYIVVFKDSVGDSARVAQEHARAHRAEVRFVYGHALKGYSATIPASRLGAVRADSRVAYVEDDGSVTISGQTVPWGISRVGADLSSTLAGNGAGDVANVSVYVIDTGIDSTHPDLKVAKHVNFAGGPNKDCNGHGTHVAGTAAARDNGIDVVGVAPGAAVVGVKVLGCGGSGSTSGVIKGVDWVTANAVRPAVANMSLGGGGSQALDAAVVRSATGGILYSVAAGNEGKDACSSSPARAGAGTSNGIVTVAATDAADLEPAWSNRGPCVDLWAPGVGILSTRKGGGTTTMSGTSMAAPHVAGGAALWLSRFTSTSPTLVETELKAAAVLTGTLSADLRPITRQRVAAF